MVCTSGSFRLRLKLDNRSTERSNGTFFFLEYRGNTFWNRGAYSERGRGESWCGKLDDSFGAIRTHLFHS